MLEDTPRPRRDASSSVTTAEARSLKIELRMGLMMSVASCCVDMLSWCDGNNLQNDIRAVLLVCSKTFVCVNVSVRLVEISFNFLFRIVYRMMAGKVMVTNKTPAWCFKQLLWAVYLFIYFA